MKNKTTALILSVLVGGLGVDRFYLGYTGLGVLKLLTGGCFGVLWIIDIINIATGTLRPADGSPYEEEVNGTMGVRQAPYQGQYQGQYQAQYQPQYQPQPQPQQGGSPFEQLQKLAELHNQGILTDEEFERLKARYLSQM